MREMILFLVISVLLLIFMGLGCDEQPEESRITNVQLIGSGWINTCGTGSPDTCSKSWYVEFKDTYGDGNYYWYWTEVRGYNGTTQSKAVRLYNPAGSGTCTLRVNANYFDFSSPDPYAEIFIGSCETSYDAAAHNATRPHGQLQGVVSIPDFGSNCWQSCCTDKNLDEGWYYAYGAIADTSDGGITKAKSRIMTRHGNMCAEGDVTTHAHQVAYVDIDRVDPQEGPMLSAQTGFFRHRLDGDYHATYGRYHEVRIYTVQPPVKYPLFDSVNHGSMPGVERTYELQLEVNAGIWHFFDNGLEWSLTPSIPEWTEVTGNYAKWTGEIYNRETDMPGTNTSRCTLDMCNYICRWDSTWRSPQFLEAGSEVRTSDPAEWGISKTSQQTIEIWDKVPL